jgi:hypothetical protein
MTKFQKSYIIVTNPENLGDLFFGLTFVISGQIITAGSVLIPRSPGSCRSLSLGVTKRGARVTAFLLVMSSVSEASHRKGYSLRLLGDG